MKALSIIFIMLTISACGTDGPDPENPCNVQFTLTGEEFRERTVPEESPKVPDCTDKGWCNPDAPAPKGYEWIKDENGEWILTKKYTEEVSTEEVPESQEELPVEERFTEPSLTFSGMVHQGYWIESKVCLMPKVKK